MDYDLLAKDGDYQTILNHVTADLSTDEAKYWHLTALSKLGHLEEALGFAVSYRSEIDTIENSWATRILMRIGVIHYENGNLQQSLEVSNESLRNAEQLNDTEYIAHTVNNIGIVYYMKGDLETALKYFNRSLGVYQQLGEPYDIARSLNNLGVISAENNDYFGALENFRQCLAVYHDIGNPQEIALCLYNIIYCKLKLDQRDDIQIYLDELDEIRLNQPSNVHIKLYRDMGFAMYWKSSQRIQDMARAQDLFKTIVKENDFNFEFLTIALNNLIELCLVEYRVNSAEEVFQEIMTFVAQLERVAKDQEMFPILMDTLILKARLSIIQSKFDEAQAILTQAFIIAEEQQHSGYLERINQEIQMLEDDIIKLKSILSSSSVARQIEQTRLMEYIERLKKY